MQIIKNGEKYRAYIMFTRCLKHVLSSSLKGNSGSAHPGGFWSSLLTGRVGWTGGGWGPRRQDHLRGRGDDDDNDDGDDDDDDDDWALAEGHVRWRGASYNFLIFLNKRGS